MLKYLINSQTRLAILAFLFKNPEKKYYAREIVKALNLDQANVHKELANLSKGNFLLTEIKQEKKYFFINQENIFFNGLRELFSNYQVTNSRLELVCIEEMPNYYPMMVTSAWSVGSADELLTELGLKKRLSYLAAVYRDNFCQLIVPRQEFKAVGLEILEKIKTEPAWGEHYVRELHAAEKKIYEASSALLKLNLKKFSDAELYKIYQDYYDIYSRLHRYHWIQTILDFDENIFSKYLMNYLQPRIKNTPYSLGDVFSVLTTPVEEAKPAEEYRNLLEILQDINRRPQIRKYLAATETRIIVQELAARDKTIAAKINQHAHNFGFLGYNTVGPAWGSAYFIDILSSLVRQGTDPTKLLKDLAQNRRKTALRQQQIIKDLKIDSLHQRVFQFARDLVFTKGTRKDSMFHSYAISENLFREIGARFYLSVRQVRFLNPHEFKDLMISKNFPTAILNERYKFSLHYSTGPYEKDLYLTGQAAAEKVAQLNIIKEEIKDLKILSGDCASPGRVRGEVKIINVPKDMTKMKAGDILVSIATTPDLVPAIKKAAAIVTDAGGITCHAAIISRELGIPCVVGTKFATKILHDGDLVDVNATHGKVDIIRKGK
ncbi:MAG: PEP-utilizing enzyme [Patescibacteria group bacterium]|jgi:phosphohistidine swiveling domain-containing protein